ncbi:hypothetical protein DXB05_08835 [Clostridium sp. OF13-4]|nr:hypothetical protein DXB05_08835 [Clostridium sp. OF13-4]
MPNFSYKALGRDGKEVRGVLQAESEAAAASRIRENYPILLSISQKKEKKRPDDGSLLEMEIGSRRIKTKKLAILCSQFAITLHSGMTVHARCVCWQIRMRTSGSGRSWGLRQRK